VANSEAEQPLVVAGIVIVVLVAAGGFLGSIS